MLVEGSRAGVVTQDMAEESWEKQDETQGFRMNPSAPSFSFNPSASAFVPGGNAKPPSTTEPMDNEKVEVKPTPAVKLEIKAEPKKEEAKEVKGVDARAAEAVAKKMEEVNVAEGSKPSAPAPVPEEEEEEGPEVDVDDSELDPREHLNVVFIGHVDAGKSTLGGQILFLTGMVDDRTIQKYEKEAKDKNRESWYMAYIMDTNEEERAKGKTVEVGRAHFSTEKKRYTVLDAPGHKNYVPNMIHGASQADVGILVIAARIGEFETGFERGGQTREHAQLAKTLGVTKLIIAVNKMDDPSVHWDKKRFDEIIAKTTPFLKSCGYNPKTDISFVPVSALQGTNIRDKLSSEVCEWYEGLSLFQTLDNLPPADRNSKAPFRMPIIDKYKDSGTVVMGKSEAGLIRVGQGLCVMPNKSKVKVTTLWQDESEVVAARPGENLRIRLSGVEEDQVLPGFVLCSRKSLVPVVNHFEAQLVILELLEHKSIFSAGYSAVLHVHSIVEECEVTRIVAVIDPKTKEKKKAKFATSGAMVICRISVRQAVCLEKFSDYPQLGRFTLRDEGRTIAIGKVVKLPSPKEQ